MLKFSNSEMRRPSRFRRTFIREWRQFRQMTLEALAGKLDMTASHLSMLERGQRGYTQESLEKIAEILKTDVASLLSRPPGDNEPLWSLWNQAEAAERQQIEEITRVVVRRRG